MVVSRIEQDANIFDGASLGNLNGRPERLHNRGPVEFKQEIYFTVCCSARNFPEGGDDVVEWILMRRLRTVGADHEVAATESPNQFRVLLDCLMIPFQFGRIGKCGKVGLKSADANQAAIVEHASRFLRGSSGIQKLLHVPQKELDLPESGLCVGVEPFLKRVARS